MKSELHIRQNIAAHLREYRKDRALTLREMAKYLTVTMRCYQSYEEARAKPPLPVLLDICDKMNITVREIIQSKNLNLIS